MKKWYLGLMWAFLAWSGAAQATPGTLSEWKEILLKENAQQQCQSKDLSCIWPGRLVINTSEKEGAFQQDWFLLQEDWVPLPGDRSFWPQRVQENGKSLVVINQEGTPWVKLPAGQHRIEGKWSWNQAPTQIALPSLIAWWEWKHNNEAVSSIRDQSFLVRQSTGNASENKDVAQWRVYKRWSDQPVPQVEVMLSLDISGSPREITLPPIAELPRFLPLSVQSDWPLEIQPDGALKIQVAPGKQDVRISLRCQTACNQPFKANGVSDVEYWALQNNPVFRSTAWKDSNNVDPKQINAPQDWQQLSWISVQKNQSAQWEVKSRGPDLKAENLNLTRNVWLDLYGKGWTVIDQVKGVRPSQNTLSIQSPFVLQSAKQINGEDELLPVMEIPKTGGAIEWHERIVQLEGVSRIEKSPSVLPVSGWSSRFEKIQWNIYLPPGLSVFTATGADQQTGTWTSNWTIADVFLLALLLALSWYFGGPLMSLMMGLLGLMAFHTDWFPGWLMGGVLLAGLIKKWYSHRASLPASLTWVWRIFMVLLLFQSCLFIIQRVDYALYPQWEKQSGVLAWIKQKHANQEVAASADEAAPAPAPIESSKQSLQLLSSSEEGMSFPKVVNDQALSIAAGPSQPQWPSQWKSVHVQWNSSVNPDASWTLWTIPAWLNRLGSLLSAILLVLILIRLAYAQPHPWFDRMPRLKSKLWVLSLLLLTGTVHANSEDIAVPDDEPSVAQNESKPSIGASQQEPWWFQKLRQNTPLEVPCKINCNQINGATLSRTENQIEIRLQVHAQKNSSLALPSISLSEASLTSLTRDGNPVAGLLLEENQWTTWVEPGIHEYKMVFDLRSESGVITWPSTPGVVILNSGDWAGVVRQKINGNTIGWMSSATQENKTSNKSVQMLPFVQVKRTLTLQSQWQMTTIVERIAPLQGPLVVSVPLLPGEAPDKDWIQKEGHLQVVLDANQQSASWNSQLEMKSPLLLHPIASSQGQEQWTINADTRWHISAKGVLPQSDNSWGFMPLPEEKLILDISQPPLKKGPVAVIESSTLQVVMTNRNQEAQLSLSTNANTNTDLIINAPSGWTLDQVGQMRNGELELLPLREKGGQVQLPLLSGNQDWKIKWVSEKAIGFRASTPQFELSLPSYNMTVTPVLGNEGRPNRWVVALGGDGLRPIAMHLPYILAAFLIGVVLGHLPYSPFKPYQWGIVGMGLVGEHLLCAVFFAVWVFALQRFWLVRAPKSTKPIVQVGLMLWGTIALIWLFGAILNSLRVPPSLHLKGWGTQLSWYIDRVLPPEGFPQAVLYSFPLWVYQGLILLWSLWVIRLLVLGAKKQWQIQHSQPGPPPLP